MQLLISTTTDAASVDPQLPGYLDAMTRHCPFLQPSLDRGLTTWSGYRAGPQDRPALLGLLVETAEAVRAARRENGPLTCANIAIFGPTDLPTARRVLDWPHWITRNLYAPVQLMIGKFWIGEVESDKHQQPIMVPPVSFFSIRHSVPAKDARFLGNLPDVAAMLAEADDDGHDVLIPHMGVPCTPDTVIANYDTLVARFPVPARAQAH